MSMKHTKSEVIDRLLNGGPRQKNNAWGPAHELVRNGELEPRKELPAPESIEDENTRRHIRELITSYDILNEQTNELIKALDDASQAERLLRNYGNFVGSADCRSKLMRAVESYLHSEDDNLAVMATYPLHLWSRWKNVPSYNSNVLLASLSDNRGVMQHGGKTIVGDQIKYILSNLILQENIDDVDFVLNALNAYLTDKDSKVRERAGYLVAVSKTDETEFSKLLDHKNTAVRRGAISGFTRLKFGEDVSSPKGKKKSEKIATQLLTEYWEKPSRLERYAIAESVTQVLAYKPNNKMSKRVSKNRRDLFSKDDNVVLSALADTYHLSLDVEDCRMVAPLLAMLLSEDDKDMRFRASLALYMVNDHQSPLPILQSCVAVATEALKKESDSEVKQNLEMIP